MIQILIDYFDPHFQVEEQISGNSSVGSPFHLPSSDLWSRCEERKTHGQPTDGTFWFVLPNSTLFYISETVRLPSVEDNSFHIAICFAFVNSKEAIQKLQHNLLNRAMKYTSRIESFGAMTSPSLCRKKERRQQLTVANTLLVSCFVFLLATENGSAFRTESIRRSTRRRNDYVPSFEDENDVSVSVPRAPLTALSMSSTKSRTSLNKLSNADLDRKIVGLGRKGKTDEALKIFESIERPNIRIINGAIDACARARPTRLDKALEIFEKATSPESNNNYAVKPNVFTFGSLLNACNRARNSDKALKLLRSMEEEYGVSPNAIVYSSAISACARSEPPKPEVALKLLKEVVEEKKLSMSVVGFNAAISACAQAGDWENAISLLTRMEEATQNSNTTTEDAGFLVPEPDVVTYGTVLAACERGGQWKLILKNAESMQERGLPLDGLSVMTCLHACAELGLAYEGLRYLDMMKSVKKVTQQTARYQRYGARKPLMGPDAVAYRCAISACARGGAWKEGIRLLEECKEVTGTPANTVAYTAAITGCEYAGEWKEAFFLLDKMRKEGVEPNELTMGAVIGACATACTRDENKPLDGTSMPLPQQKALQLLSLMKKDPSLVQPNIQVYNAAIRVCAEAGDTSRAFRILQDAKDSGIERTQFTYGSLMTACERSSCVESASKAFRLMKEDEIAANEIIYGAAISCCRKAKEPKRALLLLRKMITEELSPNAATLNTVMLAQTDAGKPSDSEKVERVYKLMQSEFVDERGRPNRYTYNILINYYNEIEQPAAAEAFLDKMRKDGFKPDVDLFTSTVTAYERLHQPLKALNLMESMQNDGYDFYGVKVFDAAFKNGVKVLNSVGKNFAASDEEKQNISRRLNQTEDYQDDDDDVEMEYDENEY